jgi:transposase
VEIRHCDECIPKLLLRGVPRVDDRRMLNGIFWVLRSGGAMARSARACYGPRTTSYSRFVRWRKAGVWGRMMDAITAAYDGNIQMIDSTSAPDWTLRQDF